MGVELWRTVINCFRFQMHHSKILSTVPACPRSKNDRASSTLMFQGMQTTLDRWQTSESMGSLSRCSTFLSGNIPRILRQFSHHFKLIKSLCRAPLYEQVASKNFSHSQPTRSSSIVDCLKFFHRTGCTVISAVVRPFFKSNYFQSSAKEGERERKGFMHWSKD
jgi:hypothetical protein